jgi:hypothetical protein
MTEKSNSGAPSEPQMVLAVVSLKAYLEAISGMRKYLDTVEDNLKTQLSETEKKLSEHHVGDSSVN